MNAILHQPAFQALESAWRGLDWLLQEAAKSKSVEVRIIDVSAEELAADLGASDRLEETGLYQILVDQPASRGELDPWSVVVGLYLFEPTAADAMTLGRVGRIARQASAPFLAGAGPRRARRFVRAGRAGRRGLARAPTTPRVVDARPGRPPVPAPPPFRRGDEDDRRLRVRGIHRPRRVVRLPLGEPGPGLRGGAGAVVRQGGVGVAAGLGSGPRGDAAARRQGRGRRARLGHGRGPPDPPGGREARFPRA